jgi:hypothetical protein
MITRASPERLVGLQGTYAGFMTRLGGCRIDIGVIFAVFSLAGHVVEYVASAVFGASFELADWPVVSGLMLAGWAFFYCANPLAVGGRTFP